MVRVFGRGREHLRVETRREEGEFVLILHQADGTCLVDRFRTQGKLRKRVDQLERQLLAAQWKPRVTN